MNLLSAPLLYINLFFRSDKPSTSNGKESSPEPEEDEITPEMIENAKKRDRKAKMLKMLDIEMKF